MRKLLKIYIAAACVTFSLLGCGMSKEAVESENIVTEAEQETEVSEQVQEPEEVVQERKALWPITDGEVDYLSTDRIFLEPKTQIAMIASDKGNIFYRTVKAGAEKAVEDLNKVHGYSGKEKITLLYGAPKVENVIDQINIIDQFLDKAPDALCIAFTDASACKTQMQMMKNNGIQLIAFDAPDDGKMTETLVSTDNETAAAYAASKMYESLKDGGKVAILVHNSEKKTGQERYRAIKENYMINYVHKAVRFVDVIYMEQEERSAEEILDALLTEHPDLDGVICTDLKTTEMAVDYAAGLEEQSFEIVGFDVSEKILSAVSDETLIGTIAQDAYGMGYATVIAAARSIAGLENSENIYSSYLWIDASNVESDDAKWVLYE